MGRTFILTRVEAATREGAEDAFREDARRHGWTLIKMGFHETHLPNIWEGAMEIEGSDLGPEGE